MNIHTCYQLNDTLKQSVITLLSTSTLHDGSLYEAELEAPEFPTPFPNFYLMYEKTPQNTSLIGFLSFSVFPSDQNTDEYSSSNSFDIFIYAFIHPNWRKKGLFTQLWEYACSFLKKASNRQIQVFFPININTPTEIRTALSRQTQFSYHYSEYIMKKQLCFSTVSCESVALEFEEHDYGLEYSLWSGDTYIGGCLISLVSPQEAMIYEFGIIDCMQGFGYGKIGLQLICNDLYDKNYQTVSLQVSGKNKIAHSLYLNCGFQITEELQFFHFKLF